MDMENISSLMAMVKGMGFGAGPMRSLLQLASLHSPSFSIRHVTKKGKDTLSCTVHIERMDKLYSCAYYDAVLLKETTFTDKMVNGVNVAELDKQMSSVDWSSFGVGSSAEPLDIADNSTWLVEANVEKILEQLELLAVGDESKLLADSLKLKHWGLLQSNVLPVGNLASIRAKLETAQRFFVFEDQCISLDEAWRFLNNKWLEKKMLESRKMNTANGAGGAKLVASKKPQKKTQASNK